MADVLVVDDDDDVGFLIQVFLEREGHRVRWARDGEKGLAVLDEALPDLVVLDVEMPLLDGPGMAAQMLIENLGRERIPILLVSAAVGLPDVARRVGTPYALAKPFDPAALAALVAKALRERRAPTPIP
jgi:DNA-binding response OmpR family regulator